MSSPSDSSSSRSSSPDIPATPKRKRKGKRSKNIETSDEFESGVESEAEIPESNEPVPEEPVLSHAERRRKKKEEKASATGNPSAKKRKLLDGTGVPASSIAASSIPKRQNSIWVGNLSYKTTPQDIQTFFRDAGEITRIHMPTRASTIRGQPGENRGFAYVDFATSEAKIAAIAKSEQPLIGRKLLIKDGDDFGGRPDKQSGQGTTIETKTHSKTAQKILRAQKQPPAPTLFLGNLGFETTEKDIIELFEAHRDVKEKSKEKRSDAGNASGSKGNGGDGWIRKVRMGTFEDSGLCKGFAFVDFASIEHATSVLINPQNHRLNGRKLVVEYASAEAVRRGASKTKKAAEGPGKRDEDAQEEASSSGSRPGHGFNSHSSTRERHTEAIAGDESGQQDQQRDDRYDEDGDSKPIKNARYEHRAGKPSQAGAGRRKHDRGSRPKPGAALAQAKRKSAAILPAQGKKVIF